MGIFEQMPERSTTALDQEFEFRSPRAHGYDTVAAIRAMRDGKVRVFVGMGGNFVRAAPDSDVTEEALANTGLTVQISTKLNHSHLSTGRRALILPTLGRTERDTQRDRRPEGHGGGLHERRPCLPRPPRARQRAPAVRGGDRLQPRAQAVHRRDGHPLSNTPAADWLSPAGRLLPDPDSTSSVVLDGFEDFEERIQHPGGFVLPHPPRDEREFETASGKAHFTSNALEYLEVPPGRLILQTLRSMTSTTPPSTARTTDTAASTAAGAWCWSTRRTSPSWASPTATWWTWFRSVRTGQSAGPRTSASSRYSTPKGCAAAYYPETNVLVPLDSVADTSGTPTSKSVIVRLEPAGARLHA